MDLGDLKSREIGKLMINGLLPAAKEMPGSIENGDIPSTIQNQNLGHNAKKEALGPNTKR